MALLLGEGHCTTRTWRWWRRRRRRRPRWHQRCRRRVASLWQGRIVRKLKARHGLATGHRGQWRHRAAAVRVHEEPARGAALGFVAAAAARSGALGLAADSPRGRRGGQVGQAATKAAAAVLDPGDGGSRRGACRGAALKREAGRRHGGSVWRVQRAPDRERPALAVRVFTPLAQGEGSGAAQGPGEWGGCAARLHRVPLRGSALPLGRGRAPCRAVVPASALRRREREEYPYEHPYVQ